MRLMWSHRDPAARKSGVGNIFIKNLDKAIDNKALHDTFSAFGDILSCKVAMDAAGNSKGYGFVHYDKQEAAELAAEKVNGMLIEGRKVFVGPFLKWEARPDAGEAKYTNVFVKNLPDSVDQEGLERLAEEHGPVTSAVLMVDDDGKSRGFGFVNYEEASSAASAVAHLNGREMDGKTVFAGRAQKKAEREAELKARFDDLRAERIAKYQGMNLYVKNLADGVDDDGLRAEFAAYGTITSAKVMRDPAGKTKGFGFVCFTNPDEATRAVTEANGRMVGGKPMYVALAQRREVRRAQLEQQYATMPGALGGRAGLLGPAGLGGGRGPGGPALPGMFAGPGGLPFGAPQFYGAGGPLGGPRGPGGPGGVGMYGGPLMGGPGGRGMMGPGGRGPMGPGGRGGPRFATGPPGAFAPYLGGPMGGRGGPLGGRGGPLGGAGRGAAAAAAAAAAAGRGLGGGPGGRGPMGPGGRGPLVPGRGAPRGAPSAVVPGQDGSALTTAMLAAAPPEAQKQMLGERLFPLVAARQPELAGKVTGMLLEMDNGELLLLLESPDALDAKVDEAIAVLKQHGALPDGVAAPAPAAAPAAASAEAVKAGVDAGDEASG